MDRNRLAEMLAELDLFGALDDATRREIAARSPIRRFGKGHSIVVQGEPGERMFVLVEGAVRFLVRSRLGEVVELNRAAAPSAFGELAALDGDPRSLSVVAIEPSAVLVMSRQELLELVHGDIRAVDGLLRTLGAIVRRMTVQMTAQLFLGIDGRVASKLLEMAAAAGEVRPGTRIPKVTQAELATMVGGSRQSVNAALRSLERRRFIRGRVAIEILRPDELARLATP